LNFDLVALLDKGRTELEFYGGQTLPAAERTRNVVDAEINLTGRSQIFDDPNANQSSIDQNHPENANEHETDKVFSISMQHQGHQTFAIPLTFQIEDSSH